MILKSCLGFKLFLANLAGEVLSLGVGVLVSHKLLVRGERSLAEAADEARKVAICLVSPQVERVVEGIREEGIAGLAGEQRVFVDEAVLDGHQGVGAYKQAFPTRKLLQFRVGLLVGREGVSVVETLPALGAHVHEARVVLLGHVVLDACAVDVALLADAAPEGFVVLVPERVRLHVVAPGERLRAVRTLVGSESGVEANMTLEVILGGEGLEAERAAEEVVHLVGVSADRVHIREDLVALRARKGSCVQLRDQVLF